MIEYWRNKKITKTLKSLKNKLNLNWIHMCRKFSWNNNFVKINWNLFQDLFSTILPKVTVCPDCQYLCLPCSPLPRSPASHMPNPPCKVALCPSMFAGSYAIVLTLYSICWKGNLTPPCLKGLGWSTFICFFNIIRKLILSVLSKVIISRMSHDLGNFWA